MCDTEKFMNEFIGPKRSHISKNSIEQFEIAFAILHSNNVNCKKKFTKVFEYSHIH